MIVARDPARFRCTDCAESSRLAKLNGCTAPLVGLSLATVGEHSFDRCPRLYPDRWTMMVLELQRLWRDIPALERQHLPVRLVAGVEYLSAFDKEPDDGEREGA